MPNTSRTPKSPTIQTFKALHAILAGLHKANDLVIPASVFTRISALETALQNLRDDIHTQTKTQTQTQTQLCTNTTTCCSQDTEYLTRFLRVLDEIEGFSVEGWTRWIAERKRGRDIREEVLRHIAGIVRVLCEEESRAQGKEKEDGEAVDCEEKGYKSQESGEGEGYDTVHRGAETEDYFGAICDVEAEAKAEGGGRDGEEYAALHEACFEMCADGRCESPHRGMFDTYPSPSRPPPLPAETEVDVEVETNTQLLESGQDGTKTRCPCGEHENEHIPIFIRRGTRLLEGFASLETLMVRDVCLRVFAA